MFKLSPRMQLIFNHLLPGKPVWDLCCDHGYIGLNAYESGLFPTVHFVDQVPAIIERLEQSFAVDHRDDQSKVIAEFISSAAENISVPVNGTMIIAGVGSYTIEHILTSLVAQDRLRAQRLILCPQDRSEKLVQKLCQISAFHYEFHGASEEISERGRIRKLLIFNRKTGVGF